jgi:hypothetical protein
MKKNISWEVVVLLAVIPLYAAISIDLPYNDVSFVVNDRGDAEFNAYQLSENAGQPALPVYTCAVLLPPSADLNTVSFSIEGLKEELVQGTFNVKPALPPQSINGDFWPDNRSIVNGKDISVYTQDQIFPQQHVQQTDIGYDYCYKIVQVMVHLTRYNPVTQQLYQMKSGKLTVNYDKVAGYRASQNASLLIPEATKEHLKRLTVNYNEFIGSYESDFNYTSVVKMAIITSNAVKTGSKRFDAFVASKKIRGIEVTVATETQWGTGATGIRTWLQSNYQTLGLQYVLLIGTSDGDVPMMTFTGYAKADCPSDFPYAQLTGDYKADKLCEVSVGRFPVYSADYVTLDAIMDKCITYESTPKEAAAWRKNALFAGPGYAAGSNLACVPLNGVYNDCVVKTPPWKAYRIYSNTYGTSTGQDEIGTETAIIAKWNSSQFGLVDWATHGSPTSASGVMSSGGTAKITNGNKSPAYVFCGSCSNASIKAGNLTYSLLKNCALSGIGGTNLTYYGGAYLTSGSDNGWAYKFGKHHIADSMTAGNVLHALQELDPSYAWMNRGPYVLYGDPTLSIVTYGFGNSINDNSQKSITNTTLKISHTATGMNFHFNKVTNSSTRLMIYNLAGNLINDISSPAGKNAISWNLGNLMGAKVGSGIYLVKLLQNTLSGSQVVLSTKVADFFILYLPPS